MPGLYLFKEHLLPIPYHIHSGGALCLFDIALHDDVAVFFIQLDGPADAPRLLAGDERAPAPAEWIQNDAVRHA